MTMSDDTPVSTLVLPVLLRPILSQVFHFSIEAIRTIVSFRQRKKNVQKRHCLLQMTNFHV